MKKFLYFMLFYFILSVGFCAGIYFLCTSDKVQEFFQEEEVKRELRQKNADFQKRQEKAQRKLRQKNATQEQVQANPQQELEKKIADFESRHKELASLPPRSFKDGPWDHSLYPDDYYNKTQQLYREEIAFIFEQYGEDYFRDCETLITKELSQKTGCILACGGGIVKREENMMALKQNGIIMYIKRDLDLLIADDTRPLSSSKEAILKLLLQDF